MNLSVRTKLSVMMFLEFAIWVRLVARGGRETRQVHGIRSLGNISDPQHLCHRIDPCDFLQQLICRPPLLGGKVSGL